MELRVAARSRHHRNVRILLVLNPRQSPSRTRLRSPRSGRYSERYRALRAREFSGREIGATACANRQLTTWNRKLKTPKASDNSAQGNTLGKSPTTERILKGFHKRSCVSPKDTVYRTQPRTAARMF